jgi:hypothetical protein
MDLKKMTIKELTELYNTRTKGKKIRKFESKAKAIERVTKLLGEKKPSKMNIIRVMFADKQSWTRQEIMKRTGFDAKNAHAAMNVLKNPNRTKNPLNFTYNKENQIYKLVSHERSDN